MNIDKLSKSEAILEAIRTIEVGGNIVIHNADGSIWCILKKVCEERGEE